MTSLLDQLTTMTVKFPNFHVDTSAYALHRLPAGFTEWMKGVGQGRVMFGTNWPMLAPEKCLAGLHGLGLSEDQIKNNLVFTGVKVGDTILSHAADAGADFLVMGGYGHSRLREFILGGVTRGILGTMTVPVLMSH